jgi:hypothetical protein
MVVESNRPYGRFLESGWNLEIFGASRSSVLVLIAFVLLGDHACEAQWYKGNTHSHTINSGGDSTPDEVAKWYLEHDYDFLYITDHGMVTDVDALNALLGGDGHFLIIRGEELTSDFATPAGNVHVHVNSLNPRTAAKSCKGKTVRGTLQDDLDAIRAASGLAQINHPNFMWQLKANDIAAVNGAQILEIANMHPLVNSFGAGPNFPSAEALWDAVLSRGVMLWGVASDDTYDLKDASSSETAGKPGRGWIVVHAQHLSADEITRAINNGDFYSSTGVTLSAYSTTGAKISIDIKAEAGYMTRYRTQFIGRNGVMLEDTNANPATYSINGDEGYVRARITDSNGKMAWTQPVFVSPKH